MSIFYTHNAECNKEENKVRRVSFEEYQILKAIYNITIVSASDNEALIFIRKQQSGYRNNTQTIKERLNGGIMTNTTDYNYMEAITEDIKEYINNEVT